MRLSDNDFFLKVNLPGIFNLRSGWRRFHLCSLVTTWKLRVCLREQLVCPALCPALCPAAGRSSVCDGQSPTLLHAHSLLWGLCPQEMGCFTLDLQTLLVPCVRLTGGTAEGAAGADGKDSDRISGPWYHGDVLLLRAEPWSLGSVVRRCSSCCVISGKATYGKEEHWSRPDFLFLFWSKY